MLLTYWKHHKNSQLDASGTVNS